MSDDDLRGQLERAIARLDERIAEKPLGMFEKTRLEGKREGVKLALAYMAELGR